MACLTAALMSNGAACATLLDTLCAALAETVCAGASLEAVARMKNPITADAPRLPNNRINLLSYLLRPAPRCDAASRPIAESPVRLAPEPGVSRAFGSLALNFAWRR